MPSDKVRSALLDIRDNAALARDRQAFYAATRAPEIISEAARRLSPEVCDRHPELPWRAIMGVGNVLRHNYENIAEGRVWRTVLEDLPALDCAFAAEIEQNE